LHGLFFTTLLLELHLSHVHDGGSDLVNVLTLVSSEQQDFESFLYFITQSIMLFLGLVDCILKLFFQIISYVSSVELETVINTGHSDFTLGDEVVLVNVVTQQTHLLHSDSSGVRGHELVEDMVATLQGHLGDDTSLLQQVCFH
jgi:fumarate reductase subunit C